MSIPEYSKLDQFDKKGRHYVIIGDLSLYHPGSKPARPFEPATFLEVRALFA